MANTRSVNGTEYRIRGSGYDATMTGRGATLRSLSFAGRDLVVPFDVVEGRPAMRGALLAPWPNRLAGGTYRFDGDAHHLPINEPARGNAIHGLVADLHFGLLEHRRNAVTLVGRLEGHSGYPWAVELRVTIRVGQSGLTHTVMATNMSSRAAPIGLGVHPYLLAGVATVRGIDRWSLGVPADLVLIPSRQSLLPGPLVSVMGQPEDLDLRQASALGARLLNHPYTALRRDVHGWAHIRLQNDTGAGVEMSLDPAYRWVHIYTSDEVDDGRPRTGVAVEPTTCPPDAFNSGTDLIVLAPGGSTRATFALRALSEGAKRLETATSHE